jgi:arylsulfatase A-like enzyme
MNGHLSRRDFLKKCAQAAASGLILSNKAMEVKLRSDKPNVILCMCDDLGWGDLAYYGYSNIQTPNLDKMSTAGIRFDRWYVSSPVCSPTRGSCLTGRHPYRYGIFGANKGHMLPEEITLAEALKNLGYVTGHFGKWHLGTLTKTIPDSNRGGPDNTEHYSPPWDNGFDKCFSTEAKVPTWDPMVDPVAGTGFYGTYYWREDTNFVPIDSPLVQGDDSRIIMDQALPFIENAVKTGETFFTVIWFHTPHLPTVAGPTYKAMYSEYTDEEQGYYGCITAMDDQVGRLRNKLKGLGVEDNTMLWFSSDNGPAGCDPGNAGPYRGCKSSLWEGGVRVPGMFVWPDKIKTPFTTDMACSTQDYFPTVMELLGFKLHGQPEPIDGISLVPLMEGKMTERAGPIGFESGNKFALTGNRYKLISTDSGSTWELYDLVDDPSETTDIAAANTQLVNEMRTTFLDWQASCTASREGNDY